MLNGEFGDLILMGSSPGRNSRDHGWLGLVCDVLSGCGANRESLPVASLVGSLYFRWQSSNSTVGWRTRAFVGRRFARVADKEKGTEND